jgi:hypothetical protein
MNIKSIILVTLAISFSILELSGQVFNPTDGSTHYGDGTTYHPSFGSNGTVSTTNSNGETTTEVDCANFPDICRELLEDADRKENPSSPTPNPGDGTPGDDNPGDDGKKDKKKKKKNPKNQSYNSNDMPLENREAISEYYKTYRPMSGVWFRNKDGKWIRIKDHSKHTATIIGSFTKR